MSNWYNEYNLVIPLNLGVTIIKHNDEKIYLIDGDEQYMFFKLNYKYTIFDDVQAITFYKNKLDSYIKLNEVLTSRYLKSWETYFFQKIKFKGKGYRIRKTQKLIKFFFWFSHINLVRVIGCRLHKIGKYKFVLLSSNYAVLTKAAINISRIRNINLFTKRGLRLARQVVFKRKGKKSAYMK